ncbi:glutathione S-transferase [Thalassospira profundimaris]|uniref:Glutathione S-transferase n=1 Tax=Thalassospira profundimaris TaxID=502049 RepID=A0A367WNX9_9PROT|nr:glutathione transferase GstA [Thalassospira profundimaris]RCK43107.1 glutathione S-transferase [Thalassospira profundimaris]
MKLYFAPNTCSLSPHIVLLETGLPHELVRVDMQSKKMSDGGDYRKINPKGYVAALMLDNDTVLTEGAAIVQYLADQAPDTRLAPKAGTFERVRLQEWLNFITGEIHAGSAPLFNKTLPEDVKSHFKTRLFARFDFVENHLAERSYLMGADFTVADAYLFTVLDWMRFFEIELGTWPKIAAYRDKIAARPTVVTARRREAQFPTV